MPNKLFLNYCFLKKTTDSSGRTAEKNCYTHSVKILGMFLTELKAITPKALSLDRIVMVALFGVPRVTPLEELYNAERKENIIW